MLILNKHLPQPQKQLKSNNNGNWYASCEDTFFSGYYDQNFLVPNFCWDGTNIGLADIFIAKMR